MGMDSDEVGGVAFSTIQMDGRGREGGQQEGWKKGTGTWASCRQMRGLWVVESGRGWRGGKEAISGARVGGMGKLPIRKWSGWQWKHRLWPGEVSEVLGGGTEGANVYDQEQCNKEGGVRT